MLRFGKQLNVNGMNEDDFMAAVVPREKRSDPTHIVLNRSVSSSLLY